MKDPYLNEAWTALWRPIDDPFAPAQVEVLSFIFETTYVLADEFFEEAYPDRVAIALYPGRLDMEDAAELYITEMAAIMMES